MAKRRWRVRPDEALETNQGVLPVVSQEAFIKAVYDLAIILDRNGGVGTILVGRQPTDLEGEFVTTDAICEWKDRTDARPQPETPVTIAEEPVPVVEEPVPVAASNGQPDAGD